MRLWILLLLVFACRSAGAAPAAERSGEQIYKETCVRCHGQTGEGVAGKSDEPLYGDRSVASLTKVIEKTMPEDKPGTLSGDDAAKVAKYIHEAFYSPTAKTRMQPAKIDFSRLTVRQYRTSVADLIGSFREGAEGELKVGGLSGQYHNARNYARDKKVIDRVDPRIEFVFEKATPDPKLIPGEEFSIRWRGSVIAEETGEYEFVVKSQNGVRLWVNGDTKELIDAWVSSGNDVREHRQNIFLLGGRAYPIRLDVFRYKDKAASIALQWKPPHGVQQTIPARNLSPQSAPESLVVSTAFPPDDSSVGYERGTSISKAWDQSATNAAIDVANMVVERLDQLTRSKAGASDRQEKVKAFCAMLAGRAFRRPLTAEEKALFVEAPFKDAKDVEMGVKRAVLLVLKSPRFLYPELGVAEARPYTVASRLALGLWDSLPDRELLEAAAQGKLGTAQEVEAQARRMLKDERTKAKMRDFLHHWLEMEEGEEVSKDPKTFPGFDDGLMADLRASLEIFLDSVIWSEKSDYRELLLADYLYLNDRLAQFYGVTLSGGEEFERAGFDPKQRSGVLTHPYLLSAFAYYRSSSPIHRGVFITRNIVGRALKPPPMAIEFMDDRFDPSLTMREKVTELTRPAACQGCHIVINPLGFSLENYDAVGRFRIIDNNKPVNASSDYLTLDGKTIRLNGARDVAEYAATSADGHRAFIKHLFNHVAKQPAAAHGPDTLEKLRTSFAASEYNIQALLVEIAKVSAMREVGAASAAAVNKDGG